MIVDIEEKVTNALLKKDWIKKATSIPGEICFIKYLNSCMFIKVIFNFFSENKFMNISIYNDKGIGKYRVTQRFSKTFTKEYVTRIVFCLDDVIYMLIENCLVEFIKSILQNNNSNVSKDY
jgi:hypothetical protein